jgi:hypothetical protein
VNSGSSDSWADLFGSDSFEAAAISACLCFLLFKTSWFNSFLVASADLGPEDDVPGRNTFVSRSDPPFSLLTVSVRCHTALSTYGHILPSIPSK